MRFLPLLLLWPCAALAQEPQIDPQTVRGCFEGAARGEALPGCIGEAASACQAQPGGGTTLGAAACLMAETQLWDDLLNAQYKSARARMLGLGGPALADELLAAQRDWITFRDADCGLAHSIWVDGTIGTVVAVECHLKKTAQRTFELRDLGSME